MARSVIAVLIALHAFGGGWAAGAGFDTGGSVNERAAAYNAEGVALYEAGQYAEAIDHFLEAYGLTPQNATVRNNLCNAYQAQANKLIQTGTIRALEEASDLLDNAINVRPDHASPYVQLASCYLSLGYVQDAIYRLQDAVELVPDHVQAHELLGDAYYRNNELASAIVQWEWVQGKQPHKRIEDKLAKARREWSVESSFRTSQSPSRNFEISVAPGTKGRDLRTVHLLFERARLDIGQKLGGVYPPAPIHVVLYRVEDFRNATLMGEHIGAVWDGKIRVPHINEAGELYPEDELKRRIYHEYTHEVVHYLADDTVPWWVNEGLAETFSRNFDEADAVELQEAFENGEAFDWRALEQSQMESLASEVLGLAYVQSHGAVQYLWDSFGARTLRQFLQLLSDGVSARDALAESYGRDYGQLTREVARFTAQRAGSN